MYAYSAINVELEGISWYLLFGYSIDVPAMPVLNVATAFSKASTEYIFGECVEM